MKEILAQIKQYKKDSILTPVFTALEVFMEMLLPFIMAKIIDDGIEKGNMTNVYIFGGVMVVAAMVSLLSGFLAGNMRLRLHQALPAIFVKLSTARCRPIRSQTSTSSAPQVL